MVQSLIGQKEIQQKQIHNGFFYKNKILQQTTVTYKMEHNNNMPIKVANKSLPINLI